MVTCDIDDPFTRAAHILTLYDDVDPDYRLELLDSRAKAQDVENVHYSDLPYGLSPFVLGMMVTRVKHEISRGLPGRVGAAEAEKVRRRNN